MLRTTVVLCTIAAQVLAAPKPNGCIEACSTYSTQQTHEALIQQQNAALNQLQQVAASQLGGFSRPGNWTEQNEYRTDGGRGRVYEEQGQVVTGPRRVQYYRKNYSSSHGISTDAGALGGVGGLGGGIVGIENPLDSQRLIGSTSIRGGATHRNTYDEQRHQEVHQTSNRVGSHSQRLEDFGERVEDTQQVLHQVPTTSGGGTWHRADSWRTDGGRGVVHEEEGQVVNGPTKVKYYRQNYSSSYSSGDTGAAVPSIIQPNLEDELQRLHSQLDSFGREVHQSTVGQSTVSQTVGHAGYVDENNLSTANIRTRPVYVQETVPESHHTLSTSHRVVVGQPVVNTNQLYHTTRGERYQETQSSGSDYSATNSHHDDGREYQRPQTYHVVSEPRTTVRQSEAHRVYQETIAPQSQIVVSDSNRQSIDRNNDQLIRTPIHTTTNRKGFHSNGGVQENRLTTIHTERMTADEIRQAQIRQNQNIQLQDSYNNGNVETVNVLAQQPAAVNRYEEKWSEGYRSHSTVPQTITSGQIVMGQHANYVKTGQTAGQSGSYTTGISHNSHSSRHESGSHFYDGFRTQPDQLVAGSLALDTIRDTGADCDQGVTTSEQYQYGAVHHRKYKREAPEFHGQDTQQTEDLTQQTEDLTQQTEHLTQQTEHLTQQTEDLTQQTEHLTQQTEDLTQQTSGFGDFGQQTSGNFEFGQQTQQTEDLTQQTEDLTQQTENLNQQTEDLTQQTEHLNQQTEDLTQQTQHLNQQTEDLTQQTQHLNQQTEDLTQHTSPDKGFSQQTSGNLEFGHQQQQQHIGKLELGQETQQTETVLAPEPILTLDFNHQTDNSWVRAHEAVGHKRHISEIQQSEDLTQQSEDLTQQSEDLTQQSEDLTQQLSGHLELGQQHQQHFGKLEIGQETQQTEDLTQQTSGHFEFGQQHQQHSGKLEIGQETQQTEDLTQQTSGHFEFGQQHQHDKRGFGQETQQTEDLTQQTEGFDDFTQQTSGKLAYGQQSQRTEDLMQQTSGYGDHTFGNSEFGEQHDHPGSHDFGHQHPGSHDFGHQHPGSHDFGHQHPGSHDFGHQHPGSHDFGHQYPGSLDFGHQHSGNYEFGYQHNHHSEHHVFGQETQQTEDLTQQTDGFVDLVPQSSGHLVMGHQPAHHGFGQETQQTEDLTQQTGGFDHFTQQASGKLQYGQQRQLPHHGFGQETQQTEDLTQQTGGFDDFTQQTSGHLQIGQHRQHGQHGQHGFGQETQQTEDLTQQTGGFDDFTQQTSGHLQIGQHRRHGQHGQETQQTEDLTQQNEDLTQQNEDLTQQSEDLTQQTEDLTQQTGGFDDFTQQTSGHLQIGQHRQHGQHGFGQETQQTQDLTQQTEDLTQQTEDLTQQTGGFDDFTQQTSGHLQIGQQRQHGQHGFGQETQQTEDLTQQTEDLTQQTGGFDDFTQQTSGHLQIGQHRQHGQHGFGQETQQTEDLTQQTGGFDDFTQQTSGIFQIGQHHQPGKHGFGQETQQTEDLSQQTGGFDDFTQQTSGNSPFGQHHQPGKHGFGQETQQTDDLSQKTGGFDDFTQQSSGTHVFGQEHPTTARPQTAYQPGVKGGRRRIPAPKPTLKPGRRINIDIPKTLDVDKPNIEPSDDRLDNEEDIPTVLGIDEPDTHESLKHATSTTSNPSTQWHQNHHPGDLTNSENLESQTINHQVVHQEHATQTVRQYQTNSGRPRHQIGNSDTKLGRQSSPVEGENSEPEFKLEPRIIEAYGGAGSYDMDHNDDIFTGAKRNPSATIPPNLEGDDPWDIRETPIEPENRRPIFAEPTEETTTAMPEEPTTTVAPSFWKRVGNKLTNTYEKAKEKATSIFGK